MDEVWAVIDEFPMYSVSTLGNIVNNKSGRHVKTSKTRQGVVKVGLVKEGKQHWRSVKRLVAIAFVPVPSELTDTPIHIDGDEDNNVAQNIVWRTKSFAHNYANQFRKESFYHTYGPIKEEETGLVFNTCFDAAITYGLLVEELARKARYGKPVTLTGQIFTVLKN